ncbi:MAG TPA: o-succinylbenzoate synthase [Thermoanaerobaculaceae bacterium]|nr:o-succinylbenzoate synthase [Thermoanaerobaculaceae bacterium]HRS16176.1 o-succinylbenzoate synthase [Thermoanaerobaculaceae bacterium]
MVLDTPLGRLERLELRIVALPLRSPFVTSTGERASREVLLVRLDGEGATGWGECAAFADPGYTAETIDSAWRAICDCLAPPLARARSLGELRHAWSAEPGERMAKAALETAVLDLLGRRLDRPLWALLGGAPRSLPAGVAIGLQPTATALLEAVGGALAEGYGRVKLKVEPGRDVAPVRAVRERFPDLPLWVDANGAYRLADLPLLRELDALGLVMLEQPLPAGDLEGLAALQAELRVPLCLDESIASLEDLERAASLGAGRVLNLKPGRVGGLLAARALAARTRELGWDVFVGGTLESSLGRAACLHLQRLGAVSLPGDLSAPGRYLACDLAAVPLQLCANGCLSLPEGPGVGVEVLAETLAAFTQCAEVVWHPAGP